ncbi:flavoprotein-like protein [Xylaria castorea]|nr:flavoprotein-like protein [Xylaria castorea]
MSTYNESDPSDNALEFVAWAKSKPDVPLENLQYAAFGCSNRNYRHYNNAIDDVVTGLTSRGATAIMLTGKGDELTRDTEEGFLEWKGYKIGYEPKVEVIEESPEITGQSFSAHVPFVKGVPKQGLSEILSIPIATQRVITTYKESNRTCVHLELDIKAYQERKDAPIRVLARNSSHEPKVPSSPTLYTFF